MPRLALASAGQELEADDLTREEWLVVLGQVEQEVDGLRQAPEVIDRDARVEQLHAKPGEALVQVPATQGVDVLGAGLPATAP